MTKEQALKARYGSEIHFGEACDIKVTRCRVSGKCQTWKTRPTHFRLPVKHGLYQSLAVTQDNGHNFHLASECPLKEKEKETAA